MMKRLELQALLVCSLLLLHGAAGATLGVARPPNDECSDAVQIGDVANMPFDTAGATFDGITRCMRSPNIWYCYTASCTGDVTVALSNADYDTMLAVYDGCVCLPDILIECNDDFGDSHDSRITFAATAGDRYMIEIGAYDREATGQGLLTVSCGGEPPPPPPSKDDCANAQAVGDVTGLSFDTSEATFDGPGHCMTSPNIWYCYTASCTGDVTVSLLGSSFDTVLAVYKGCGCYPTAGNMIGCNDDSGASQQSEITFAATAGSQYLIEVGGYGSETGQGLLSIGCEPAVSPSKSDLGDASDSTNNFGRSMTAYPVPASVKANYPTVFNDGSGAGPYGPVHLNAQLAAHLGKKITRETEADIGPDEDGVNNINPSASSPNHDDGDDGIVFPLNLPPCRWTTFDYLVNVIEPGTDLWVNVWLDWNRDGDWDDTPDCASGPAPEWAVQNQFLFDLPAGLNRITTPAILPWHPEDGPETIWMRITLSERPWKGGSNPGAKGNGGSGPRTKYQVGETEDYYFVADTSRTVCEDFNGDGVIDSQDLVDLTAAWLENCPQ